MMLCDFGTSYTKVLEIDEHHILDAKRNKKVLYFDNYSVSILKSTNLPDYLGKDTVEYGCGHNSQGKCKENINELVALSIGARSIIKEEDFICLDVGSRDIKYVRYANSKFVEADWNCLCGAMAGFTMELIQKYFDFDYSKACSNIDNVNEKLPVTCGILGISNLFDAIAHNVSIDDAIIMFVKGLVDNIYNFLKKPDVFYLSGGLCNNKLFVNSFPTKVIPLGRNVLLRGLFELFLENYIQ